MSRSASNRPDGQQAGRNETGFAPMSSQDLLPDGLISGADGLTHCWWCGADPLYRAYHDQEWGRPVADDRALFEKLCLEGFQAGLSWLTILRKRPAFRRGFGNFEPEAVARFDETDIARLLADVGIVRHRGKIEAAIANARACLRLRDETGQSLAAFLWRHAPPPAPPPAGRAGVRASCPESEALAKELRRRGWRFLGPTTLYAFMQSMGFANDHLAGCHATAACAAARQAFRLP
jgi:DNA-3-methyladenine glycosylase I